MCRIRLVAHARDQFCTVTAHAPVDRVFERHGPLLIRSATTISRFRLGVAVMGLPVDVAVRQALIGTSESPRPAHAFPLRAHAGSPSHALEAHGPPRRQGAAARLTCRRRCHHHSAFAYCHQPTIVLMSTAAEPPRRSQRKKPFGCPDDHDSTMAIRARCEKPCNTSGLTRLTHRRPPPAVLLR